MRLVSPTACLFAAALTVAAKPAHAFSVEEATRYLEDAVKVIEPYYPRELVDEWAADYFSAQDRAGRLQLSQDFPRLFGVKLACRFTPTGKDPVAVIPGDWIEAPDGGALRCADGAEATVRARSKVQLQQLGGQPALLAAAGSYVLKLGATPFALRTTKATLRFEGRNELHQLEGSVADGDEKIRCNVGNVTAELRAREDAGNTLLESYACRFELRQGEKYFYLFASESIQVPNLSLERSMWPRQTNMAPPDGLGAHGFVLAPQPGKDIRKLSWTVLVPRLSKLKCTLYRRAAQFQRAEQIKTFEAESGQGELSVTAEEGKGLLSAVCEGETFVVGSQFAQLVTAGAP